VWPDGETRTEYEELGVGGTSVGWGVEKASVCLVEWGDESEHDAIGLVYGSVENSWLSWCYYFEIPRQKLGEHM
jgi:hypothetical protein